jgi:transcriptional regulator
MSKGNNLLSHGEQFRKKSWMDCFEIKVERIDAKYKLSQNRNEQDRQAIISHLEAGSEKEREVAAAMRTIDQAGTNRVFTKTSQ